jgi:hypothetical protein
MALPGAESGMVILEYNGLNAGDQTWVGPTTGTIYVLGGIKKRSYVDKQDAGERPSRTSDGSGLLAMRENNRFLFNLYESPEVEIVEPEPVVIKEPEIVTELEPAIEATVTVLNPTDYNVKELKEFLPDLSLNVLRHLQGEETRKTALSAIEAEINARLV